MEQLAREAGHGVIAIVESGMMWVVRQAVGEADWTSIHTLRYKAEKTYCKLTTKTWTGVKNNPKIGSTLIQLIAVLNLLFFLLWE